MDEDAAAYTNAQWRQTILAGGDVGIKFVMAADYSNVVRLRLRLDDAQALLRSLRERLAEGGLPGGCESTDEGVLTELRTMDPAGHPLRGVIEAQRVLIEQQRVLIDTLLVPKLIQE